MRRFLSITLAAVVAFSLAACGSTKSAGTTSKDTGNAAATEAPASTETPAATNDADAASQTADGQFTIGFSVYDLSNEYFQSMLKGVEAEAKEKGIKLITHDQKSDENELVTGCNNLLDQGVDALIVSPCKPEVMGNIVDAAHAKNVPVIILDIGDGGSDKDAIVVSDMYGGGQIAGKYALDLLKKNGTSGKDYAIIKCEESATYAIQRGQGFENIMDAAGYSKVKEITANSDTTEAYTAMQDILASNPNIVAVFCENDNMALGASSAIDEAGKTGDILVFGFDGNESAVAAIKDGTMTGTIAQQPTEIGKQGISLALQAINGETLTYDNADKKEIYADVYLIDNTGNRNDSYKAD